MCALAARPGVTVDDGAIRTAPLKGKRGIKKATLYLPRAWMSAVDALVAAHYQTGLRYVIIPEKFNAPVGPFEPGKKIKVEDLVKKVGEGTGTKVGWIHNVPVFDPLRLTRKVGSPKGASPIEEVTRLDARRDSSSVVALTDLVGVEDASVRIHALAALQRLEGDFMRSTTPGRASIMEVLSDKVNRQALLFALEEGGPLGGRCWKFTVELLGRGRERLLARHLWEHVWQKKGGVMELGLWGLGRCGDRAGGWAMRSRVRATFTNDPSHRYLAAMAIGQINEVRRLKRDRKSKVMDLRRATAFGLGFAKTDNEQALRYLLGYLSDSDPSVQFVACQALARLGNKAGIERLIAVAKDSKAAVTLRLMAMEALVVMGRPEGAKIALALCTDVKSAIRTQAATLLSDVSGSRVETALRKLSKDKDKWVRRSAVYSLARRGSEKGVGLAAKILAEPKSDADDRISALLGLGRSLSPTAAKALGGVAHDTDMPDRLRRYAVLGLARLANRAGQKLMVELADRDSGKYMPFAVRHLALETEQETAEYLIPYLTHGDRSGACGAAGRLAEMGCGPGISELLEGGDIEDNHTRMMHMWGAVRGKGRDVTLSLIAASRSPRGTIRRAAAFALGQRLYPEVIDALIRLARDKESGVRQAAAQALGLTPDPRAVKVLMGLAKEDKNMRVAVEAIRSLRRRDYRGMPGVRELFEELKGTARDVGGINSEQFSTASQPENSFVLRTWAEHPEEDLVSNLTYESSLCYDAYRRRIVMWGAHGRRYDTPQMGQTWFYDAARSRWDRLVRSRQWPNGTCGVRGTMFDNANAAVVAVKSGGTNGHGWHNALRANLMYSSPWILDVKTDQWYAARTLGYDTGGYMPGSHDPVHGITLWWKGKLMAFDVYANRWSYFNPKGAKPKYKEMTGGVFDPGTGRFIAIGAKSTWAFDPAKNNWTDLKPKGVSPSPCPMVYDSVNGVMLAFKAVGTKVCVWVYRIRKNTWEKLPAVNPSPAHGTIWDAAYDAKNNVVVVSGKSAFGATASLNARETWTYRYKAAGKTANGLRVPREVKCVTAKDGTVRVNWHQPGDVAAAKYRVERGVGELAWQVKWETVGELDGKERSFKDRPGKKDLTYYRVFAINDKGKVGRPSSPGRTAPRILHKVTAVAESRSRIKVKWAPSLEKDVVGYHVYRATVDLASPWEKRFDPKDLADSLKRITKKPVTEVVFVDKDIKLVGPTDALNWPKTYAYVIRPVNAWGLESGVSPITLALPDPPGPMVIVPWADGRRLVLWEECLSGGISGHHLMRMDDWHRDHVFRLQVAPLQVPAFVDSEEFPRTDRRRYSAVGLDGMGTIGIPGSGTWSHGYP